MTKYLRFGKFVILQSVVKVSCLGDCVPSVPQVLSTEFLEFEAVERALSMTKGDELKSAVILIES